MSEQQEVPKLVFPHSYILALYTGAEWGHCYESAYRAFFAAAEVFHPDGLFIEGWIVFADADSERVILMEHGWLVRGPQLLDPTLVLVISPTQPVFYFPGVIRSWDEALALENELFPHVLFENYSSDGMGHPGYKAAYEAARAKAESLLIGSRRLVEVRAADPATNKFQSRTGETDP